MSLKAIWEHNTYYSKFMISVGIVLISAVFFTLLSTFMVSAIYRVDVEGMAFILNDLDNPVNIAILKLVQTVSATGTFIVPPLILAWLFHQEPVKFLSVDKKPELRHAAIITVLMIVAVPVVNYLGEMNSYFHLPSALKAVEDWMRESESQAARLTEAFLVMHSPSELFFNIIMIAMIPALGEELLFRGLVQKLFSGWLKSHHAGVWLTSILFSAMHMQFYGFIPRLLLGAMLGYLLVWSGNLWWPVLAHFINNAAAVIFSYLYQNNHIAINADTVGLGQGQQYMLVFSLAGTALLLYLLYRDGEKKRLLKAD